MVFIGGLRSTEKPLSDHKSDTNQDNAPREVLSPWTLLIRISFFPKSTISILNGETQKNNNFGNNFLMALLSISFL